MGTLQAGGVPAPVDGLQIEAIGYPEAAACAHHRWPVLVLLLRGRRRRWLQLRYRLHLPLLVRRLLRLVRRRRLHLRLVQDGLLVVVVVMVVVMVVMLVALRWHAEVVRALVVVVAVLAAVC